MGLLDGLFGQGQQAAAPGQGGLLGQLQQLRQTSPELFQAAGNLLTKPDTKDVWDDANKARTDRMSEQRRLAQQQGQFDQSFGLQRERLDMERGRYGAEQQALGTERAQRQQQMNQTLRWAESTGDPDVIGLAGAGMFDEAFKVWNAKSSGREPPKIVERFDESGRPQKMMWDERSGDFVPFGGSKAQSNGITVGADGSVQIGGPMRESEAKANIYASRMEASNELLKSLEGEGTDLSNKLMSGVPVVGNYGLTSEYRQYEQAQRDFINATLRQESGAVISPEEFENGKKQYFPQPGDDPTTIAQKARNRETAIRAIRQASGQPAPSIIGAERPLAGPEALRGMSDADLEALINGE